MAQRYGLGRAVVERPVEPLVGPGTLVAGSFVDLPGDARPGPAVLPRPGAVADQAPDAGPAAQGGRTGRAGRVRAVPGRVAGHRLPGSRAPTRCSGCSSSSPGYPLPASAVESIDPAGAGGRLHPGHARRAHRRRRGVLGGRRCDRRVRRLDPLVCGRPGAASAAGRAAALSRPGAAGRLGAAGAPTSSTRCCRPALAPADRAAVRRRALGAGLGRPGHRRHLRAGAQPGSRAARTATVPAGRPHPPGPAGRRWARPARPGARIASPTTAGRWSLVQRGTPTHRRPAGRPIVFAQLDRYGVVTRGSVLTEGAEGGFGAAYRALSCTGGVRPVSTRLLHRGAGGRAVRTDRRRRPAAGASARARRNRRRWCWPPVIRPTRTAPLCPGPSGKGHRPGRKAGALVVLVDGALVFYVERGGKTLLSFTEDPTRLAPAASRTGPRGAAGPAGQADGRAGRRGARLRLGPRQRGSAGGGIPDDAAGTAAATSRSDGRTRPRREPSARMASEAVTRSERP